jgi:hypothetical protein
MLPFNWENWHLDNERKKIERAFRVKLKRKLFEAGYRAVAKSLHPDAGGSATGMSHLTAVRDEMLGERPDVRKRNTWTIEWKEFPPL